MGKWNCIVRNYQQGDLEGYARLRLKAQEVDPAGAAASTEGICAMLARPGYSAVDDLFVAEAAGDIVGYLDVSPELSIGRVVIDGLVSPEHRRRGVGTGLLERALRRAVGNGASVAHVNVSPDNVAARELLSKLGFKCVRRFLELRLELASVRLPASTRTDNRLRHLDPGEEPKLADIQNRCFAGTWGYSPNTVEEIAYRTALPHCSVSDIIVVCDGGRIVGYCWTTVNSEAGSAAGDASGHVYMIGVHPECQGRGMGRQVLLAGLRHLRKQGVRVARLFVDSENRPARSLYGSVGFGPGTTILWHEKALI